MSVEAYTWALNLAPVPMDKGGARKSEQPSSSCAFVLVALANHADPDGTNAFPGVDTIMRYTRLSERTVRTCLDRLEEIGVITPCDPDVIAAKIKRADRRPNGYDLDYTRMREDLTDAQLNKIGKDNPWLRPWIEQHRAQRGAMVATRERGATVAGRSERGATITPIGVQPFPARGATVAPEPSLEPSNEPSFSSPSLRSERADVENPAFDLVMADASPAPAEPTFEEFYDLYPKKADKADAKRAWEKWVGKGVAPSVIMAGLREFVADPNLPGPAEKKFIKNAATWLNKECWNHEPLPPRTGNVRPLRSTYDDDKTWGTEEQRVAEAAATRGMTQEEMDALIDAQYVDDGRRRPRGNLNW